MSTCKALTWLSKIYTRRSQSLQRFSLNVMLWVKCLSYVQNSSFCWIAFDNRQWLMNYFTFLFFFISVPQPVLHPLLLCSKCVCLHHGSHPMCPLLMASVVIEFDAAHLQPNKRAVCKNPNSPIQYYWYFTGCIIKLNNPLWLEVKWWNSFQWPQLNHKQKAFRWLCIFIASHDATVQL